jgi:hypothetical protein
VSGGGWAPRIELSKRQRDTLRNELGAAAERYIEGAQDALRWYAIAKACQHEGESTVKIRGRLLRVARAAHALGVALEALGPHAAEALYIAEARQPRLAARPTLAQLRGLHSAATEAAPVPAIGAPAQGAMRLLLRELARHYRAATGRQPGKSDGGPFDRALRPVLSAARIPTSSTRRLISIALEK